MGTDIENFVDDMCNHFKQALFTGGSDINDDGHYLEGIAMASHLSEVSIIWIY